MRYKGILYKLRPHKAKETQIMTRNETYAQIADAIKNKSTKDRQNNADLRNTKKETPKED